MSVHSTGGVNRSGRTGELGEIVADRPGEAQPIQPVLREDLLPGEAAASLPPFANPANNPIAPLTKFLGPLLTVANPAWGADPIPRMRGLQKKLVEHSLKLDEGDRTECLAAITVVETAVQLRLRYQQMRMTEAEMDAKPTEVKAP